MCIRCVCVGWGFSSVVERKALGSVLSSEKKKKKRCVCVCDVCIYVCMCV